MKLIIQIAVIVGLLKRGIGSVRLRGKVLQHPNVKECMIELTDSVYHLILICTKEFHVYLKNLTNHNVTPWLYCPPGPYFSVVLIDDKNELIVCRQKAIQQPIELWCEKSELLPKNYKCEDTYVFDDGERPSTSATYLSLTNASGTVSSNASNQHVLDSSNVALGNVNNFMENKWMPLLWGIIGILLILLLLLLIIHYFKKVFLPKQKPSLLEKSSNEYLICNSCGAETQRKHTCTSQV
uniref:Uncharacterized protein n=1 Tax=Panagrolaimus sp. PS1159 TaxID=55785 RepID=A0AC35G712_9BILA